MRKTKKVRAKFAVDLKQFELFAMLKDSEIALLDSNVSYSKIKRKSIIYRDKTSVGGIYVVVEGIARVVAVAPDSKELTLRFAKAGDPLGYRAFMAQQNASTTTVALIDCVVCFIPNQVVETLLNKNSAFAAELMMISALDFKETNEMLYYMAYATIEERLAFAFLTLMRRFDLDIEQRLQVPLTREDLAFYVGTATESIIRVISDMKKEKLIDVQGKYIKLVNIPGLIALANV